MSRNGFPISKLPAGTTANEESNRRARSENRWPRGHATLDLAEQVGQRGRVVREISVDLDDDVVAAVEGDREAGTDGLADPDLAGPAQHLDLSELRGDFVDEVRGAVGAVVINDQDVGGWCGAARTVEELHDVLRLLVGRSHDERTHRAETYLAADRRCRFPVAVTTVGAIGPFLVRQARPTGRSPQNTNEIASASVRDGQPDGGETAAAAGPPASSAPPSPVVVTGGAGWLGQNLVRTLARGRAPGCAASCASGDEAACSRTCRPTVEAVVGDVRDPGAADRLFDGVGRATVFHAAGVIHPSTAVRELFDVNVGGTQLVLDRARRAGASRFVHVSSNSPFGANRDPHRPLHRGLAVPPVPRVRAVEVRGRAARAAQPRPR